MGLLIQCLRDVRARSGDLDLLPPTAGGASCVADLRARDSDGTGKACPPSEVEPGLPLALHANWLRHAQGLAVRLR